MQELAISVSFASRASPFGRRRSRANSLIQVDRRDPSVAIAIVG
jgi:hypothetical protein